MEKLYNLPPFTCKALASTEARAIWEQWRRGFEICMLAEKVTDPTEKRNQMLAYGGFELQDVFYSIPGANVEEDEQKTINPYAVAISKLESYFAPRRHDTHERYLFWTSKPEGEESLEKFLMRAEMKARKCNFGKDENESRSIAVIDKIILLAPSELREKLLLEEKLDLDTMIKVVNAYRTTKVASEQMARSTMPQQNPLGTSFSDCFRCGKNNHHPSKCRALMYECRNCGTKGHFANKCKKPRSKNLKRPGDYGGDYHSQAGNSKRRRVNAIDEDDEEDPQYNFIACIGDGDEFICAKIGDVLVELLIDSGSPYNLIDEKTWEYLKKNKVKISRPVEKANKHFKAYGQKDPLTLLGMFEAIIEIDDNGNVLKDKAKFYVVKNGSQALLGKLTAKALKVLELGVPSSRVAVVKDVNHAFPKMKGFKIHIQVDENIRPVAQPMRKSPIATLGKIEEKLEELLSGDIIEKVSCASQWVSPLVIVIKDGGEIRLCIDMRQVNKAILRENHPLPTLEDFRPRLKGAMFFSRLDIKNAFHQLELDEKSRYLQTFITHKGMFRYKRLMFGISCAPEMFQKVMEQILSGCKNALSFIDDIVVHGANEAEHNEALQGVLGALKSYGVLLNTKKCIFKVKEIDFLGHHLSSKGITPSEDKIKSIKSFRAPQSAAEVRSFLGLVTYVGSFIPNLATITIPLRQLTRDQIPFEWGQQQEQAFNKLK